MLWKATCFGTLPEEPFFCPSFQCRRRIFSLSEPFIAFALKTERAKPRSTKPALREATLTANVRAMLVLYIFFSSNGTTDRNCFHKGIFFIISDIFILHTPPRRFDDVGSQWPSTPSQVVQRGSERGHDDISARNNVGHTTAVMKVRTIFLEFLSLGESTHKATVQRSHAPFWGAIKRATRSESASQLSFCEGRPRNRRRDITMFLGCKINEGSDFFLFFVPYDNVSCSAQASLALWHPGSW